MKTHMRPQYLLLLLITPTVLVSCTTFTKQQCESMDWQTQGYKAALAGVPVQESFNQYQKSCREVQVSLAQAHGDAFARGYDIGREKFCTAENASKFAGDGGVYRGTCPDKAITPNFMASYQSGREKFLLGEIQSLRSQISDLQSKVSSQAGEISSLQSNQCR